MKYFTIPPHDILKKFVRFFWVLESGEGYLHRSMADVCPEMIFHYKGSFDEILSDNSRESSFNSGIHGQTDLIRRFKTEAGFGIFGVYLYPYSLPILFNVSSSEVTNQQIDLFSLLGKEGRELEEKIFHAKNTNERIDIISCFLMKKLPKDNRYIETVNAIESMVKGNAGFPKIRDMARQAALSERQFERKFKFYSGLTPKLFSRIVRFHAVFAEFHTSKENPAKIALDYGYYDQSHLIQDCKAFSGEVPTKLFSTNAEGLGWVNS